MGRGISAPLRGVEIEKQRTPGIVAPLFRVVGIGGIVKDIAAG
jgi:hypothetical protein